MNEMKIIISKEEEISTKIQASALPDEKPYTIIDLNNI